MINEEVKKLAKPIFGLGLITYAMFSIFGYYQANVFLCILFSCVYTLINFKMIGEALNVSLSKSPTKAQIYMTGQYIIRYIITGCIIYYSLVISFFNPLAVVIPLFFPKIILISQQIFKKGDR